MHVMLKRAAASAIPALLGLLAISPATAMAASHTSRAVAGPVKVARQTHERLVQWPRSGTHQGHLAGITSTAKTTADDPAINCGYGIVRFYWAPRPVKGGTAIGVIVLGNNDKIIDDNVYANGGSGIDNSTGSTVGNGIAGTAGNSLGGRVAAAVPPQ
jgi:hypothetical protein